MTNSVPRTPMIELGVRTRIASGDCFTILPEMTASVPFLSEASNWPACVVLSNTYFWISSTLFGPTDSRLLSVKVMPAAPSEPVTSVSDCSTGMPMLTGRRLPPRSRCTAPLAVLTWPASAAAATAKPNRIAAMIQRMLPPQERTYQKRFYNRTLMADSAISTAAATFAARGGELGRIGTFLNDFCVRQAIGRERCLKLNLVIEELFTNTVRHGHRGDCEAPVWVSIAAGPAAVHVTYEDTAPPFN